MPLAAGVAGCNADRVGVVDARPTPKVTVMVRNGAYDPPLVRVPAGGRVTFVGASIDPVTAETDREQEWEIDRDKLDRLDQFDTHTIALGEAISVEFDTPGTYLYHSSFDGAMFGTVEVVSPDS